MTSFLYGMLVGLLAGIFIALATLIGVWAERKVAARIQMRLGPQEAGPFGLLQTLADTLKLILKEDITPSQADVRLFRIAPFMVFVPCAAGFAVIPFALGWAPFNIASSALFYLAVPGLSIIGVLVAGWSSRNTFASIGSVRGASQMISYELPRTLSVLSLCVLAGTVSAVGIHDSFRWWWIPVNAIGFLVFFITSIAEVSSVPFDLPVAESELVAGYYVDYSGIRFSIFAMVEYGGMVSAAVFGTALFFGGGLGIRGPLGALIYAAIAVFLTVTMMWVKWTYPRMRSDQLMNFAWKVLTPMALGQLMLAGVFAAVIPWH